MVFTPNPQLTFGALNLIGTDAELESQGYRYEALGDDLDWGSPILITEKVQSWLTDGALVANKGYDNRTMNVRVKVVADDSNLLAVAEGPLFLETGKPNLLTWTPPDGEGEPCVFSVVMSELVFVLNDLDENRIVRTFALKITAEPFVRSLEVVTVSSPAPTGAATITNIAITSSATGWSSERIDPDGTITAGGLFGSPPPIVAKAASLAIGNTTLRAEKTGIAQSLSGTPYLRVEVDVVASGGVTLGNSGIPEFVVNGGGVVPVAQYGDYYWLDTTGLGGTLNTLRVGVVAGTVLGGGESVTIRISDVSRADEIDSGSTNRQLVRVLSVDGSARAQGSILIEDSTFGGPIALGDVIVYTSPNVGGLTSPNLRQHLSSGNTPTVGGTLVSGISTDLSTLHTFEIPASALAPGGYLLLAKVRPDNSGPLEFTWSAEARMGSTDLGGGQSGVTTIDVNNGAYSIVTVASLNLPPRKMGPEGVVRIELTVDAGNTLLDEAWIFNVEAGRLSIVSAGIASPASGGSASKVWLDAPTIASPTVGLYLGTESDRSDAFHAGTELAAFDVHELAPPFVNLFIVTTNSAFADASISHHRYFHTHVTAAS